MKQVYGVLEQNRDLAFATVGGDGKPRVRVFQIMKIDELSNTIYFATVPEKEVFIQLQNNSSVELLAMSGNISIRITGDAIFDVPDAIGQEIYFTNPVLSRLYKDYRKLVYFRVPIESLDFYNLSTNPPTLKNYKL